MRSSGAPTVAVALRWALLVVAVGLAWWLLAPQPPVVTDGTARVSPVLRELSAGQDGVFVLVSAVAGVLTGAAVLRRRAGPTGPAVVAAVLASALGALLARLLGGALGALVAGPRRLPALPDGVEDQLAEGVVVAPSGLVLSADVALVVWPLLTALVVTGGLLVVLLRDPDVGRTSPAPAEPAPGEETADGPPASAGDDPAAGPDGETEHPGRGQGEGRGQGRG